MNLQDIITIRSQAVGQPERLSRNRNIDLIKVISMIFVIGLHSRCYFCEYPTYDFGYYLIHSVCGLAIPLFFMVNGYLLLGRERSTGYSYSFKKIYAIAKFVFIITTLYYCVYGVVKENFDPKAYAVTTFGSLLQYGTFGIFWYFGAMICIYLVYPIVNKLYNNSFKQFLIGVGVLSSICCIIFAVSQLTGGGKLEENVCQTFRIWNWVLYFSLGGMIKRYNNNKMMAWIIVALSAIIYLVIKYISTQFHGYISPEYAFGSIVTQIYACSVFMLLMNLKLTQDFSRIIDGFSNLFLPVYAFHMLVISHTGLIASALMSAGIMAPLIYWMIVTLITIGICYILMKLPYVNKIFRI